MVKNVKNIQVKVYQLDLERHYHEQNSEIDETQDLSYLQPNSSYTYEVKTEGPFIISYHEVIVEGIGKNRGVWIVELEGEGIISRAFIRKGAIGNHSTMNSVGHEFSFFDEEGNRIKDLDIWMSGKKHHVVDKFNIPYGTEQKQLELILVKDSYAEKIYTVINPEEYNLNIGYLYSPESFIVGNKARVALHPRLTLAYDTEKKVSLKLLDKVSISVSLKNAQGNDTNLSFDNVKFKAKEDYILEFPIQGYVSSIEIIVNATVNKYNGK